MNERETTQVNKAQNLKKIFIDRYNNIDNLNELTEVITDGDFTRAINELANEFNIKQIEDYKELRRIAIEIKLHNGRDIFLQICKNNNIEDWIKDNGNYYRIVVDAFIEVFKRSDDAKQKLLINAKIK